VRNGDYIWKGRGRERQRRNERGEEERREEAGDKGGMGVDPTKFGRKSTLLISSLRRAR